MLDDKTPNPSIEPSSDEGVEVAGSDLGQNVGVYLLDAASPEERIDFEQAVAALPEVRAEAVHLAPVVVSLNRIYDLNPEQAPQAFDLSVASSPELKERVLTSVSLQAPEASSAPPAPIASAKPIRPQGRVLGGVQARPTTEPIPIRSRGAWRTPWAAAAAMLIVAVGVTLWGLSLQNRLNDQSREIHAQSTVIANSNASAYALSATGNGPSKASGTLFYSSKDQKAVLVLNNMPVITDSSVYQLWYIKGTGAPAPGATFKPNADGSIALSTNATIGSFDVVALTKEPAGGSKAPTSPVLMAGTTGGVAG